MRAPRTNAGRRRASVQKDDVVAVIFPRWTNLLPLAGAVGGAAAAPVALLGLYFFVYSPEWTDVGYQPEQPVPFSHQLHAGELGMDCRYCHYTVERSDFAAVPPAGSCMNCHAVVRKDSRVLEPVRRSAETGEAIPWKRVHLLPDYVFFSHGAHVAAGVGCESCHGRVDRMPEVHQDKPLSMLWCLDCHRDPEPNLRPVSAVTAMGWTAPDGGADTGVRDRQPEPPLHCSGCHR